MCRVGNNSQTSDIFWSFHAFVWSKDYLICHYVWTIIYTLYTHYIWVTYMMHNISCLNVRSRNGKTRFMFRQICWTYFELLFPALYVVYIMCWFNSMLICVQGSGDVKCAPCSGSGQVPKATPTGTQGGVVEKITCGLCKGTGKEK